MFQSKTIKFSVRRPASKKSKAVRSKPGILRAVNLSKVPWLVHGFSTRGGGFSRAYGQNALNLGFTKDDSEAAVKRNRAAFLLEVGANGGSKNKSANLALVTLRQIHSDIIHSVDSASRFATGRRWPGYEYSRITACHSDRRLPSDYPCRPAAPCRRRLSCRLARNGQAHRGERSG